VPCLEEHFLPCFNFFRSRLLRVFHLVQMRYSVLIPFLLLLGALVFLLAGATQPWYEVDLTASILTVSGEIKASFYLTKYVYTANSILGEYTTTEDWTNSDSSVTPNERECYELCAAVAAAAFILFVLAELLLLIQLLCKMCWRKRSCAGRCERIILILLVLFGEASLIVSFFLLFRQPAALDADFQYYTVSGLTCQDACTTFKGSDAGYTWGPAVGWWLTLVSIALGLLACISVVHRRGRFTYQTLN